jgi:putative ABC transport system permease protein
MFTTSVKGLLAHKVRLALTAMAIVLGVSFIAGTYVFTDSINARFDSLFTDVYAGIDVSVDPVQSDLDTNPGSLPADLLDRISGVDGVEAAVGQVDGHAQLVDANGDLVGGDGPPTLGMSWVEESSLSPLRIENGNGRAPRSAGEVVIDVATAEQTGFTLGDRVEVQFAQDTEVFEVVGLTSFGDAEGLAGTTLAIFELTEAQRVLDLDGVYSSIVAKAADGVGSDELKQRVAEVLPSGAEASTGAEQAQNEMNEVSSDLGFLTAALLTFAGVAVFVGAFIIQNTFRILVAQRTREFGLLRAIGAGRGQITTMVGLEALVVGLIASGVGIATGVGLSYALAAGMNAMGFGLPDGSLTLQPRTVVVALLVGVVTTLISALLPAIKAARVPPVAALSDNPLTRSSRSLRTRAITGAVATTIGVGSLAAGLVAKAGILYVAIGAAMVFLGVAVLAPLAARPVAELLGRPVTWLSGMAGTLAKENTKRKPRRTASTAAALMIGIALVTFVSIFAATVKSSVEATVAESFPVDLAIQSTVLGDPSDPDDQHGFPAAFTDELRRLPELGVVSAGRFGLARIDEQVEGLVAIEPETIDAVYELKPSPGALADASDGGLLVSETKLGEKGWAIGQPIEIEFAETGVQTITIGGTFRGENFGPYLIAMATYEANYTAEIDSFAYVTYADGVDGDAGRAAVEAVAADYPSVGVQDRDQAAAGAKASIDQLLAMFWGLLGIAIVIAVMGITNTLALSIAERTREVGLLRAVGMSRRQVRSMIRWEAVIVSLFGATIGIGLGILLGWSVTQALGDIGLRGLTIPGGQIAIYVILAGVAGVLAAAWPARSAARMNVLQAISHE